MDLKTLFIQLDNELQNKNKTILDCKSILSNYNLFDYIDFITKEDMDKLQDENTDYIRISIPEIKNYSPQYFDAYLLVWSTNNFSRIHDHPEKGCALKVLKGSIKESRYSKENMKKISKSIIKEGEVSYIHNKEGFHKVKNAEEYKLSISLHIYSPKGYKTNYF